jgi:hypothetical protein
MADLKRAMKEVEQELTDTIENILFDMQQALEATDYDEVRKLFDKTQTRIEHGKIAMDAHLCLGQIAL